MDINIKQKINRIDFELKELFDSVTINENFHIPNQLTLNIKTINVYESYGKVNVELKAFIDYSLFNKDILNWKYLANPNDANSIVERQSTTKSFTKDINDVVELKRFDKLYLESLTPLESINESKEFSELTFNEKIETIFEKYNLNITKQSFIESKSIFEHDRPVKMSEKFMIESEIKKINDDIVIIFKESKIELHLPK